MFKNSSLQDSEITICKMTVYKKLWYNLQDDSLQGLDMVQFAKHRYGSLQDYSLQDIGMNAISKNMVDGPNLDVIWIYDHKDENA